MRRISVQQTADIWAVFSLVLLAGGLLLPLIPAFVHFRFGDPTGMAFSRLMATFAYDSGDGLGNLFRIILKEAWQTPHTAVLSLFLLVRGVRGAVLLVQGTRILASVSDGAPLPSRNTRCLKRAAPCCFAIAAALFRQTAEVQAENDTII